MRNFKLLGSSLLFIGIAMAVSSSVSASPVPAVKKSSTFYYHVEGTEYVPGVVTYTCIAINDCQVLDIPGGSLYHLENVEAITQADPKQVFAVANSPPPVPIG